MDECFVIQPFDSDKFDRRYDDIFRPAILTAGYEPYRVDRDPATNDLVQAIKDGLGRAAVVFAELTTDNPNVWFELGYALAKAKPFCIVCAEERQGAYPFDVRGLKILPYRTGSSSDFDKLREDVTNRLRALGEQDKALQELADSPANMVQFSGLSEFERVALAFVLEEHLIGGVTMYNLQSNMEKVRYTKGATTLAVLNLQQKQYVESREIENYNGEPYSAYFLTERGLSWIQQNPESLVVQVPARIVKQVLSDEDTPF